MSEWPKVISRPALIFATIFLSFASLILIGEVLCRVFFPDNQLRYKSDPEALYFFEPNQKGIQILSNGLPSPLASINALGLRGADPQEGKRNILILGDSFTFGAGVADEETFVARLHEALKPQVSVINGGQPGYGVFQMEAALNRLGEILKPELVIVVIWQGDFLRRPPDEKERASIRTTQTLSRIIKNSVLFTHIYRMVEKTIIVFGSGRAVVHVGEGGKAETPADSYVKGLEEDHPILVRINELAKIYGKGLVIVLWPKEGFVSHLPIAEVGLSERLRDSLEKLSRESLIPFISLQPTLRAAMPFQQLVIAGDGHPTPIAHCLAAQTILETITSFGYAASGQISCPWRRLS